MKCLECDLEECVTYLRFADGASPTDLHFEPTRAPRRGKPPAHGSHPARPDRALLPILVICELDHSVEALAGIPMTVSAGEGVIRACAAIVPRRWRKGHPGVVGVPQPLVPSGAIAEMAAVLTSQSLFPVDRVSLAQRHQRGRVVLVEMAISFGGSTFVLEFATSSESSG